MNLNIKTRKVIEQIMMKNTLKKITNPPKLPIAKLYTKKINSKTNQNSETASLI